jgi:acyl carrier protein
VIRGASKCVHTPTVSAGTGERLRIAHHSACETRTIDRVPGASRLLCKWRAAGTRFAESLAVTIPRADTVYRYFAFETEEKGDAMKSTSKALVHHLLAFNLRLDDASIRDTHRFDELGLDALDLMLIALRLETFERDKGDFPVAALEHPKTVGDLVALVDLWWQRNIMPSARSPAS